MRVIAALLFLSGGFFWCVPATAQTLPTISEIEKRHDAAQPPAPEKFRETIVSTGSIGTSTLQRFKVGKDERVKIDRGPMHSEYGTFHGDALVQTTNGLTVYAEPPGKEKTEEVRFHEFVGWRIPPSSFNYAADGLSATR